MNITLSEEEYTALVALGRAGVRSESTEPTVIQDRVARFEEFLRSIEKNNGVTRYLMWVQWQEADAPLPPGTRFPEVWPPELRYLIERLDRPISKTDVMEVLTRLAKKPVTVLVTVDPAGRLGWSTVEAFFS